MVTRQRRPARFLTGLGPGETTLFKYSSHLVIACLVVSACGAKQDGTKPEKPQQSAKVPELEHDEKVPPSPVQAIDNEVQWSANAQTDPMTDKVITTARAKIIGDRFDIGTEVICSGGAEIAYRFTAFDKKGLPAGFLRKSQMGLVVASRIGVRVDAQPATLELDDSDRYSNVIGFSSARGVDPTQSVAGIAAKGSIVTIELNLDQGDQVIQIDQRKPALQAALKPCLDGMNETARQLAEQRQKSAEQDAVAQRDENERRQQAEKAACIETGTRAVKIYQSEIDDMLKSRSMKPDQQMYDNLTDARNKLASC